VSKFDPDKLRFDPTKPVTADEDGLYRFPQPDGTVITARRVDWRAERERALPGLDPTKLQLDPEQHAKAKTVKGRRKQKPYAQLAMSLGRRLARCPTCLSVRRPFCGAKNTALVEARLLRRRSSPWSRPRRPTLGFPN
jgi:hypothetical protein